MNQATKEASRPRIVIGMDGGLIQWILADVAIEVLVLDYDVEDLDSEQIVEISGDECLAGTSDVAINPREVEEIFAEFKKGGPP